MFLGDFTYILEDAVDLTKDVGHGDGWHREMTGKSGKTRLRRPSSFDT